MLTSYWFVIAAEIVAWLYAWARGLSKKKRNRIVIAAFFVVYIASVCFRSVTVGVDTANYIRYYDVGSAFGWELASRNDEIELGFQTLASVISLFGGHELFLIVTGLISVLPVAVLYYREAESGPLCCSFFLISLLFEFFFSGIRQALAISLGIVAFHFVQKKRLLPYLAFVALAMSMHESAFVLLALYPLYHVRITQKWVPFVVVAIAVVLFTRDALFNTILLPLFGESYLDGYAYLTGESSQMGLSILFLLLAIYACVMLDPKKADPKTMGFRNLLLLAAMIHLFTPLHPTVCRINYYFILFIPLAISRVNDRSKQSLRPVAEAAELVLPIFFIAYFLLLKDDSLLIAPYIPFFM